MKVYCVNNNHHVQNDKKSLQNSPSFSSAVASLNGPVTNALTNFFSAVERGGFASSFILNDVTTTCFPRTYQAIQRGSEKDGKKNWLAGAETALREFITGPSMFGVPALIIYIATKFSGSANHVPVDVIKDFSQVLRDKVRVDRIDADTIKREFYTKVFEDIAERTFGKDKNLSAEKIETYVNMLMEADNPNMPKREKGQIINNIFQEFIQDKKVRVAYEKDFTTGVLASSGEGGISMDKILKHMQNYANEAIPHVVKEHGTGEGFTWNNVIDKFRNKRVGTRFITNISAYIATAAFLAYIPKIYSFNDENPETKGLYNQVEKNRRGAINENRP